MEQSKVAAALLEQWQASLRTKDRTKKAVPNNFEELFSNLKAAGIPFDIAHDILPKAIKAHLPNNGIRKQQWLKVKHLHIGSTEAEFGDQWCEAIKSTATEIFFIFYPIVTDEDDDNPKRLGGMSVREYGYQMKIASMYKTLDTTELERKLREQPTENFEIDNILGDKK